MQDFDELILKARQAAKKVGLKKSDIAEAIRAARGKE